MGNIQAPPPTESSQSPAAERLDSWKEIGAYLKRDIRTLRRWEKNEGLPIRRHLHERKASVFAYKAELDAWWTNRGPRLQAEEARGKEANKRWKGWTLALVVLAVIAGGAVLRWRQAPVLPFEERDWVLIAQFENRTGEPVFDRTLEYALERELSNSRFVNVVPRERIEDTLQLMKKPTTTAVDSTVGREVCLRDDGIRALITGRVEKLDTTYVVSAALVNPGNGVSVASFSEEAVGQKEVVPAIRSKPSPTCNVLYSSPRRRRPGTKLATLPGSNSTRRGNTGSQATWKTPCRKRRGCLSSSAAAADQNVTCWPSICASSISRWGNCNRRKNSPKTPAPAWLLPSPGTIPKPSATPCARSSTAVRKRLGLLR